MSELIKVEKINNVFLKVTCEPSTRYELMNYFSFRPPGYQFTPSYKNKVWDGYIRLYSPLKPVLYIGLLDNLVAFCNEREYQLEIDDDIRITNNYDVNHINRIVDHIKCNLQPHDYQIQYILNAINNGRTLSLSPTSSGKSLIIYLILQHYKLVDDQRALIIVPSISLVHQMASDFIDYGCSEQHIHKIQGGSEKNTKAPIVISTWQSLIKQPQEWFNQFGVILGDEAHTFQAKSLTTIMEKILHSPYRHGFTGTISSESKVHKLVLQGLFGPICQFITTKQLMDRGTVADFNVKALLLNHSDETKKVFGDGVKAFKKANKDKARKASPYNLEKEFLINMEKRNLFIRNLVWSLEGQNNLILFDRVEKHGKVLEPLLRKQGRVLHFVHGGVSGEEREQIRHIVENDNIYNTTLVFSDTLQVTIASDADVILTNGTVKKASDITSDDDVATSWINSICNTS